MAITMRMKELFFDRPAVQKAMDKATRKALGRAGAFIRTRAKSSIRKAPYLRRKTRGKARSDLRRASSKPGNPPYSQVGTLKRFLFFAYDPASESVVVGPERITRSTDAPHTLEFGGRALVKLKPLPKWWRTPKKPRPLSKRVFIKKRPYMLPALKKEAPNLPKLWANSIRGTRVG